MKNGSIYLSGGMEYSSDLGAGWRKKAGKKLAALGYYAIDITYMDVLYSKEHGDIYCRSPSGKKTEMLQRKADIRKHFVDADLRLINEHSDALIIYYDESVRRGAGTIAECQVAFNAGIPIFLVSAWEDWEKEVPGWLFGLTTKIFTSFDDLYEYMGELPDGILTKDIYGNRSNGTHYLCSLSGNVFTRPDAPFVFTVSPLYEKRSHKMIRKTNEVTKDRYGFFMNILEKETK